MATSTAVKIGVVFPQLDLGHSTEAVGAIGTAAERLGYEYLFFIEHVVGAAGDRTPPLGGPYTEKDPFREPLVTCAYLAGITTSLQFMTGILVLPQRQTVLVAKQVAEVSLLSQGRLRLGVAVGWNAPEYEALGQDFRTRGARLDEQLALLRQLWSEPLVDFTGRFHRLDHVGINPLPERTIPLWIGGHGEAAIRRAVAFGDGFVFSPSAGDPVVQIAGLKAALARHDRSLEDFGADIALLPVADPADILPQVERWGANGGTHCAVNTMALGLDSVDAHVDYMRQAAAMLDLKPRTS